MDKKNIYYFLFFAFLICGCQSNGETITEKNDVEYNDDSIRCPQGKHTDSIVEIIYGMPSEELFRQADSGLVALGGCELPKDPFNYYCKKHGVSFH